MKKILVLHGVNLNMFGKRDPAQCGTVTLDEINRKLEAPGNDLGCTVEAFQTNDEGAICGKIHDEPRRYYHSGKNVLWKRWFARMLVTLMGFST